MLSEKLEVEVEVLDEFVAHTGGGWYMVKHLTKEEFCDPLTQIHCRPSAAADNKSSNQTTIFKQVNYYDFLKKF